ncbi:uncharacterized protein LOC134242197 isoform X2 [Saccostrea cucullata]|uniref:uncharacterized protein LOC134242197 isoform X2 n=1 Tax=Saccostrea cuccullata TaxID=36930 RepID=UPI002ED62311
MNIFFIIIHFLSINEVSSEKMISNYTMKWLDAQIFCRGHGMVSKTGKLSLVEKSELKVESYWSRQYTKRSDWIHFLGCYDQDTVLQHVITNLTVLDITVVKCQLFCLTDPKTFGIQGNSCLCFFSLDPEIQRLHIHNCNSVDEKFPAGNNSIFIYRTTVEESDQELLCVLIFCDKEEIFTMADCGSFGNALCTNKVLMGNYSWDEASQGCVQHSTYANYLKADIDLHVNPASTNFCTNYNISFSGPLWLGIRSSTFELEYKDDLKNLTKDIKCQSCGEECTLEDCSESRRAFCESASEGETISKVETTSRDNKALMTSYQNIYLDTSTIALEESSRMPNDALYSSESHRNTYSLSYTQDVSTKVTQLGSSSTQATTKASSEITPVVYSVPLALAVIIVVVCFLYCRKKRQKRRNLDVVSTAESKQLPAHFVANTELYEIADNSKLCSLHSDSVTLDTVHIPKSHGDITGEKKGVYEKAKGIKVSESTDVYNHLWEKDITIEQKENIYDHSSTICDTENPLYDVTTKTDHKVSPDPTYDHAVHLDNLTEGKTSEVNKT